MALHAQFPSSPYEPLLPDHRWFPAAEELRATAYEKLLSPLVGRADIVRVDFIREISKIVRMFGAVV